MHKPCISTAILGTQEGRKKDKHSTSGLDIPRSQGGCFPISFIPIFDLRHIAAGLFALLMQTRSTEKTSVKTKKYASAHATQEAVEINAS